MNLKSPYLLFLPFLLLFVIFVLQFHTNAIEADEGRYLQFADNLVHGFYSPPAPKINLWNGPGYPLVLAPFVWLRSPLLAMTMLNAVLYYLSIVFLFKALSLLVPFRKALAFSLFWAFYINAYQKMARINSETLTLFLVALLAFCLLKAFIEMSAKYLFLSGVLIGCIVLTKIIFGHVLLVMLLGSAVLWIVKIKAADRKRTVLILLIASAVTAPYLAYTYHLTGRVLYWGNSAGLSLYWMSTPYKGEFGDIWHGRYPEWHKKKLAHLPRLKSVEQDDELKRIAMNNIRSHPLKYASNWIANLGRLFFNYPYSRGSNARHNVGSARRTLLMLPFNLAVFIMMCCGFFMTMAKWRRVDHAVRFLFIFVFLYLGASSLVSAYSRQFYVIVPVLLVVGACSKREVVSNQ